MRILIRGSCVGLGCILYELAMLRSPFKEEGLNLYGLFQKISRGVFTPVTGYSPELGLLVNQMLMLDPTARPGIDEVMVLQDVSKRALSVSPRLLCTNICN